MAKEYQNRSPTDPDSNPTNHTTQNERQGGRAPPPPPPPPSNTSDITSTALHHPTTEHAVPPPLAAPLVSEPQSGRVGCSATMSIQPID